MKLLFPIFRLEETDEKIDGTPVYVSHIEFNTVFALQNWGNKLIITMRLFGFGFTKVWKYD